MVRRPPPNWQAEISVGGVGIFGLCRGWLAGLWCWRFSLTPAAISTCTHSKDWTERQLWQHRLRWRRQRWRRRRHIICANYRQRVAIFSIGNDAAGSLDSLSIYGLAGWLPHRRRHCVRLGLGTDRCETSTAKHECQDNVYQQSCQSLHARQPARTAQIISELHESLSRCDSGWDVEQLGRT